MNMSPAADQGFDRARFAAIPRTLTFVLYGDDVLLMKRGAHKKAFPNKYNALGGHIERGEDAYTSALREVYEESGLTLHDVQLCGVSLINLPDNPPGDGAIILFVYVGLAESRAVTDSAEGSLHWIARDALPSLAGSLVEDVPVYLGRALDTYEGRSVPFSSLVTYDQRDAMRLVFAETNQRIVQKSKQE